jgi:hypothetical protein
VTFQTKNSRKLNPKFFEFISDDAACIFYEYIMYLIDFGSDVREYFRILDARNTGEISLSAMQAGMASQDIEINNDELQKIMDLSTQKRFDFSDFFHTLLGVPVYSLRDCLLQLKYKAMGVSDKTKVGDDVPSTSLDKSEDIFLKSLPCSLSFVAGEKVLFQVPHVRWLFSSDHSHRAAANQRGSSFGTLVITNYRLILLRAWRISSGPHRHSRYYTPPFFNISTLPLNSIHKLSSVATSNSLVGGYHQIPVILMNTKDGRTIKIFFINYQYRVVQEVEQVVQIISNLCYTGSCWDIFAFKYASCAKYDNFEDGWKYSDICRDYDRMGLLGDPEWQV